MKRPSAASTSSQGTIPRRSVLQAGAVNAMGLSMASVSGWQNQTAASDAGTSSPRAVIYLFMTGGPSQHDTFDMKPDGPAEYKGEFNPIPTRTPGTHICEHLPMLAERSQLWSLVRSLTHSDSGHDRGTYVMLTGRQDVPVTFRSSQPQTSDWPSIAAVAGASTKRRGSLPSSVVLPEKSIIRTRVFILASLQGCSAVGMNRG
jgi:hypothetical protein